MDITDAIKRINDVLASARRPMLRRRKDGHITLDRAL